MRVQYEKYIFRVQNSKKHKYIYSTPRFDTQTTKITIVSILLVYYNILYCSSSMSHISSNSAEKEVKLRCNLDYI